MKLEEQVASLELCRKLKELGVRQESAFYWSHDEKECSYSLDSFVRHKEHFAAFTVAELGQILMNAPIENIDSRRHNSGEWTASCFVSGENEIFEADTEADARAKMLCYLIEQRIVNPKES